jgi:hypothetical protein
MKNVNPPHGVEEHICGLTCTGRVSHHPGPSHGSGTLPPPYGWVPAPQRVPPEPPYDYSARRTTITLADTEQAIVVFYGQGQPFIAYDDTDVSLVASHLSRLQRRIAAVRLRTLAEELEKD